MDGSDRWERCLLPCGASVGALRANLDHPSHRFWEDDIPFVQSVEPFEDKLVGHRQVSDAYLLGLAIHKRGKLATLNGAILSLLPEKSPNRDRIAVI